MGQSLNHSPSTCIILGNVFFSNDDFGVDILSACPLGVTCIFSLVPASAEVFGSIPEVFTCIPEVFTCIPEVFACMPEVLSYAS